MAIQDVTITRRDLLRALGGLGLGLAGGPIGAALAKDKTAVGAQCFEAFRKAAAERPWLNAFRSVDADRLPSLEMSLEGRVPKGLTGTLYRNGPTGLERRGVRYQHWFDGDGMVQAFRLTPEGITHQARKVRTDKYTEERKAGRFLYGGAGSYVPNARRARDNNATNPANIAVVPYDGRLLALWEAGSAHAIDPISLATQEAIDWSPETARLPFSAHPVVDRDGGLWNFGLAQWVGPSGMLVLYRIEPQKGLTRVGRVPLPFRGYAHSFVATQTKLVLYLSPNVFDTTGRADYVSQHRWRPELGGRILVVDKNDFSQFKWFDSPPGFVFHIASATEDNDGSIRFRACWNDDAAMMNKTMRDVMWGKESFLPAPLATVQVSPKGKVRMDRHDLAGEFPAVDRRPHAAYGRRVYMAYQDGRSPWMNAVGACDTDTGRTTGYSFGPDTVVEEHLFVPRPGAGPDVGWLVGTHFNAKTQRSGLAVFDAQRIEDGPKLTASMARTMPLGFHGWFTG